MRDFANEVRWAYNVDNPDFVAAWNNRDEARVIEALYGKEYAHMASAERSHWILFRGFQFLILDGGDGFVLADAKLGLQQMKALSVQDAYVKAKSLSYSDYDPALGARHDGDAFVDLEGGHLIQVYIWSPVGAEHMP